MPYIPSLLTEPPSCRGDVGDVTERVARLTGGGPWLGRCQKTVMWRNNVRPGGRMWLQEDLGSPGPKSDREQASSEGR